MLSSRKLNELPEKVDGPHRLGEVLEPNRFDDVGIDSQVVSLEPVFLCL
jgi:hypothetical protein